jgi:PilZ domain-containing protein
MSANDRRVVPRKPWAVPVRFIVHSEEFALAGDFATHRPSVANAKYGIAHAMVPHEGQTFDLSERGIGFKSQQAVSLDQSIELFFTLPTELTGRAPQDVRCTATVVHVDDRCDRDGFTRVGATIEHFERMAPTRTWGN